MIMGNHPHPGEHGELLREDVLVPLGVEVTDAEGIALKPPKHNAKPKT